MKKKLLCLAAACTASPFVSAADTGQSLALEEVIVTATKRGAYSAQDVSIAISALDGSALDAMGATQFDQWAGEVPGLNFESWGPGDKDYVIRGINSPTGGTVGVYYDEAVTTGRFLENGGGRQVDIKLHDLSHVEILKGPQGTLYGANSLSGTIRYISKRPNLEKLEAYVEVESSATDDADDLNTMINAMIDVPVVADTLGLRIVGWKHDNAGYIDNNRYHEDDVNEEDTEGVRAILRWQATEDFVISANYTRQNLDLENDSRITPSGVDVFVVDPASSGIPGPSFPAVSGGDNISTEVVRTPWEEEVDIYGLTAEWRVGPGTLTATTKQLVRALKPGGLLIIAVPNYTSFDARYYGPDWAAYDVPRHLWHFAPASILRLVRGVTCVSKRSMPFDSYYVSLLSEKYRNSGLPGRLRGMWNALRSNMMAMFRPSRASSVIYVFQKPLV